MSDPSLSLHEARDLFLAANGFSLATYRARRFVVPVGFVRLVFPNPGQVHIHDLHHILSGYPTTLVGEGEVSAYELRAGASWVAVPFCLGAMAIGFALSPARIVAAWRRARGTRALYREADAYESLLAMSVREVRARLRIPDEGWG